MKTYLFDFDGTLVDSMSVYAKTILKILDEFNVRYDDDVIKTVTPLGMEGTAKYLRQLGVPLQESEIFLRMGEGMLDAYRNRIAAKEHVIEALCKLKCDGASLNVLTASPHVTLDVCLKRLGIFSLFSHVWSCDDFKTGKSDPEIYRKAADKLNRKPDEILFLDDNLIAVKTAKNAGLKVCGVFDPSSVEYVEEMKKVCDYFVQDFRTLPLDF